MKRVIASYARNHSSLRKRRSKLRAAENDIQYLETCNTVEDVMNHEYELFNTDTLVRKLQRTPEDQHTSVIDEAVEDFSYFVDAETERYANAARKVRLFEEYVNKLKAYLDIKMVGDYAIIPIGGANPESLVDIVDTINSAIGSDYYFTGRGGSWTAYNIRTPDGVEMKVGSIDEVRDNKDCYGMEVVGIG